MSLNFVVQRVGFLFGVTAPPRRTAGIGDERREVRNNILSPVFRYLRYVTIWPRSLTVLRRQARGKFAKLGEFDIVAVGHEDH